MAINKLGLGLALACGTLAVGANFAAPAQASPTVSFSTVNITGVSDFQSSSFIPPTNDVVTFTNAKVEASSTGIFTSYIGKGVTLSNINLTSPTNVSNTLFQTKATYSASARNPFITFDKNLKFIVDNPFDFERVATKLIFVDTFSGSTQFQGTFVNAFDEKLGVGLVTLQELKDLNNFSQGSFSLTLTTNLLGEPNPIPEPATVFGLTTVLAAGYLSRKKLVKKQVTEKIHP